MCLDASSAKKTPLSEEHFLSKLDQMRDHLKEANLRTSDLLSKVDDLNLEGKDKDAKTTKRKGLRTPKITTQDIFKTPPGEISLLKHPGRTGTLYGY